MGKGKVKMGDIHVMFWVLAKWTSERRRSIDTTVTLNLLVCYFFTEKTNTYKAPTLNIINTPIFFFVDMCRFQICVTGKNSVTKSMTIPIPACAKARLLLLTQ